jgi:aryl-phospho-beta-D-glucosidase BglC (GH1 family)
MATSAWNKYQDFSEQLIRGVHDFDAHVFKVALTNTAPTPTHTSLSQIGEIAAGNGYTAGGNTTTVTISETAGTATVSGTEVVFTASGPMAEFRYAVLYNDTATSPADALIAWFDYGSAINLTAGETFTVRFNNASTGTMFTLT